MNEENNRENRATYDHNKFLSIPHTHGIIPIFKVGPLESKFISSSPQVLVCLHEDGSALLNGFVGEGIVVRIYNGTSYKM